MTAPTPGAVLDAESVKLLLPGDLLRVVDPHPGAHAVGDVVEVCADGEPEWVNIMLDGIRVQQYPSRFRFLGRPDADGWIKHDGGPNPVPGQRVEVRYEDGTEDSAEASETAPWGSTLPRIIAYRLARPTPDHTPDVGNMVAPAQPEPGAGELADLIKRLQRADEYEPLGHDGWEAADALTQAQAKIARLEGEVAERDARVAYLDHSVADYNARADRQKDRRRAAEARALSAEADAAKVREALVRLLEINEEWVGAAEPGSAYDQARQALAAKTERRA